MAQKNKLQKFAELNTFKNVYQNPFHENPILTDHTGEQIDMKGQWHKHFGNKNPITLELACGGGEYTLAMGKDYPNRNFIGIDIKGNRIWKGARVALAEGQDNVAFLRSRIEFIEHFFEKGEVQEIWITFADPQLKKARKRLTSPIFLDRYRKFLAEDNLMHLKTDSPVLYEYTLEVIEEQKLELLYENSDIYAQPLVYPELRFKTFYEKMHLEDKRTIKYIQYKL
ncbi:MAG: tRNA (guanosine(46)-N7)-methyltransferase TrmB [Aureispira sp.]|nr:tRNA (guanosine(46)-N7)-methyltransferase TrmB [Aureispira sp.]